MEVGTILGYRIRPCLKSENDPLQDSSQDARAWLSARTLVWQEETYFHRPCKEKENSLPVSRPLYQLTAAESNKQHLLTKKIYYINPHIVNTWSHMDWH